MNRTHEKLLIATLAGLIIAGAAAIAVTPALAASHDVNGPAQVTGVAGWDVLSVRSLPTDFASENGEIAPDASVWVERCVNFSSGDSWCLVDQGTEKGWVNAKFLTEVYLAAI